MARRFLILLSSELHCPSLPSLPSPSHPFLPART